MITSHTHARYIPPFSDSELSAFFTHKFPDQTLSDVLSNFSLPVPLSEIKEVIEDEVRCHTLALLLYGYHSYWLVVSVQRVVIWLLQHRQIVQVRSLKHSHALW